MMITNVLSGSYMYLLYMFLFFFLHFMEYFPIRVIVNVVLINVALR